MKRRLIIGLCCVSVFAALYVKEVGAVTCVSPYSHRSYLLAGVEKHSCVRTTTGSTIFDWGFWGVSKKSIKNGLSLQVELFGTQDAGNFTCNPAEAETGNPDPDCLINGLAFCCNRGGGCGGQGRPFSSPPLSAFGVLSPGECDTTGKCRDVITLDVEDEQLQCQNANWGGTFTPFEMFVRSCTCDAGFDGFGNCAVTPSCNVEFCEVDLTGYQPGDHRDYTCTLVFGDEH